MVSNKISLFEIICSTYILVIVQISFNFEEYYSTYRLRIKVELIWLFIKLHLYRENKIAILNIIYCSINDQINHFIINSILIMVIFYFYCLLYLIFNTIHYIYQMVGFLAISSNTHTSTFYSFFIIYKPHRPQLHDYMCFFYNNIPRNLLPLHILILNPISLYIKKMVGKAKVSFSWLLTLLMIQQVLLKVIIMSDMDGEVI